MDDLDIKLFHDLRNSDIEVPIKCSEVIKNSINNFNNEKIRRKTTFSLAKIAIVSCASLTLATGVVFAGVKVVKKIFKEPEKVIGFYSNENKNEVAIDGNDNIMTEEEAKEKMKEILTKFGKKIEPIKKIELTSNPNDYELSWYMELDNGTDNNDTITINAKRDNSFSVLFSNVLNENAVNYRINEDNVEKTARDICKKYGYDTEKYNKVNIVSNSDKAENSYLWYVNFYKEYDGIVNPYERINISFIPEKNEVYSFEIEDLEYENNSQEITKEQAKQTVIEAERKINTEYNIKNINVDLDIAKANGDAYKRITDFKQYYNEKHTENYPVENIINYRTESRVRKVWKVTVEYDISKYAGKTDTTYKSFDRYYIYYVDATTGEIIGGRMATSSHIY